MNREDMLETIADMRNIVKPYLARQLKKLNFEGCGDTDKAEFETDFEIILTLAEQALTILSANKWIPVTYRPMTDEEKKDYSERTGYDEEDLDTMLDCPLPEDGEMVLITDRLGNIEIDTFVRDCDGCYFECNCDMEDVVAWMPLPKPWEEMNLPGSRLMN